MSGHRIFPAKLDSALLWQGLCFGLCFFAFQLTEFTVNDRCAVLLGAERVNAVYAVGVACTALGFLAFSGLRRLFPGEAARKRTVCLVGAVAVTAALAVVWATGAGLFLTGSFLALLALGCIGGNVYYNVAMSFQGSAYTGRVVGVAAGGAVLAQFAVQNLFVTELAFVVGVALSVALLVWFAIRPARDWMFDNPLPYSAENKTDRQTALTLVLAVLLMSLVVALIDGVVVALHAEGQVSVSDQARLFYAAGLIVAGLAADVGKRRFLPLVTVCVMFASTIANAFLASSATYFWSVACMYLYCGFYVVFLTVAFLDLAPQTRDPALWAGMGRVIRGGVVAVTAVPTARLFASLGSTALVVGSCLLSVLTLLALFRTIAANLQAKPEAAVPAAPSEAERQQAFADQYNLTPRETEVLAALLSDQEGVQEMADALALSRRVMQRYITAIYEKTSAKSRLNLFQMYSRM